MADALAGLIAEAAEAADGSAELAEGVERLAAVAASDAEMALIRIRKLLEYAVHDLYSRRCGEPPGTRPLEGLLQRLAKDGHLPRKLAASANLIRDLGNIGAHGFGEAIGIDEVAGALSNLVPILRWYRGQVPPSPPATRPPARPATRAADLPARPPGRRDRSGRLRVALGAALAAAVVATAASWRGRPAPERGSAVRPLPGWAEGLPATSALRVAYQGMAPAAAGRVDSIDLVVLASRGGGAGYSPLADGEALSPADSYAIDLAVGTPGSLYVFQVDGRGKLTVLFPKLPGTGEAASGSNPIAGGSRVRIPPEGKALYLDDSPGLEHLYVVHVAADWHGLESELIRAEASGTAAPRAEVARPLKLALRGVGGVKSLPGPAEGPGAIRPAGGPARYAGDGPVLVIERWFRHLPAKTTDRPDSEERPR